MEHGLPEPEDRRAVVEGRPVIVRERPRPIPPSLDLLLNGGRGPAPEYRLWPALRVSARWPLKLGGAAAACATHDHRIEPWLEGFHIGSDNVARTLRLEACQDCGAVCVRDVTIQQLPTATRPGRPARRGSGIIGWYTGARPRQRAYT